ncbi:MAG: hypothetical protein HYU37_19290 [Acidobacteria bacterium]|nr:hypothetical protein [Acidobacteriota bacterium]
MGLIDFVTRADAAASHPAGAVRVARGVWIAPTDDRHGRIVTLEQHTLSKALAAFESNGHRLRALGTMAQMYRVTRRSPDMSDFRLGPNPFERIPVDWTVFTNGADPLRDAALVAHGLTARIAWNGDPRTLPRGWQGVVRACHEQRGTPGVSADTLVGLFIKVEDGVQQQGWAGRVAQAMRSLARRTGLARLIIPLRLPTRYTRERAALPFHEVARRRREDGQYADHWLRLHVRLGATIIGECATSHQHAMHVEDFHAQFEAERCAQSGYVLAQRKGEWYQAYVDLERECVVINEGCVWVQHALADARR